MRLDKKLQGKSVASFQELLELLSVCQDLIKPLLTHPKVKAELEILQKNPFIETTVSFLQPMIESYEKNLMILLERVWVFMESGFSLSGKSLHHKEEFLIACQLVSLLDKKYVRRQGDGLLMRIYCLLSLRLERKL